MSWSDGIVATGEAAADALVLAPALDDALGDADVPVVHAASATIATAPTTPFHDDRIMVGILLVRMRGSRRIGL
jgi:hypothetical protein